MRGYLLLEMQRPRPKGLGTEFITPWVMTGLMHWVDLEGFSPPSLTMDITFINITRNKILPQGSPKKKIRKKKLNTHHSSLSDFVVYENKTYLQLVQNRSD